MSDAALQMDRMYRWQRHIYDFTRKPYLLGRDRMLAHLGVPAGGTVLEIGCGTGRNLIKAARRFPDAQYHGFDVAAVMVETARKAAERAGMADKIVLALGDATEFDSRKMFGREAFDRVFISYSLSMIPDWRRVLEGAADRLAPGGALFVADFGMAEKMPDVFRSCLFKWLDMFDVHPRADLERAMNIAAARRGYKCDFEALYRGYAVWGMIRRP